MDDQQAIRRLKDGDIGGLEQLIACYQTKAVRTAYLTRESIEHCIQQLPDSLREVVILIDMERLDYAESAKILGIPLGTVKSRLAGSTREHECRKSRQFSFH